jgi:hypothetical protein
MRFPRHKMLNAKLIAGIYARIPLNPTCKRAELYCYIF